MESSAKSFAATTQKNVYQVFGHRNREKHAPRVHGRSFALEGAWEFGKALRACMKKHLQMTHAPRSTPIYPAESTKSLPLESLSWLSIHAARRWLCRNHAPKWENTQPSSPACSPPSAQNCCIGGEISHKLAYQRARIWHDFKL